MAVAESKPFITPEEYLRLERAALEKHEYYAGEIFVMQGGTVASSRICANVIATLHNFLRGKNCDAYDSNLRVRVPSTGLFTYPDVLVMCEEPAFVDSEMDTVMNPTVIIEVLSESTEAYDRGKKFEHYKSIPSFQDYVLISQWEPLVHIFSRQPAGAWIHTSENTMAGSVHLPSIGCELTMSDIYYHVRFLEAPPLRAIAT